WRFGLPTPTTIAIESGSRSPAVGAPHGRRRASRTSVVRLNRTPRSEEERDGSVQSGLEALDRPATERVVRSQDQPRHRPPVQTEDSPDLGAPRAGLEVLEAHDAVQVARARAERLERDHVLEIEPVHASLSRAREAPGHLAGHLVPDEVQLRVEAEHRPPRRLAPIAE